MENATVTLSSILTDVGSIVTNALSWAGDVVDFIVANPIVMIFVIIPLVGQSQADVKSVKKSGRLNAFCAC